MPPDAEPVVPARTFAATASERSGVPLGLMLINALAIDLNPESDLITLPKPTSEDVLRIAKNEPTAPKINSFWYSKFHSFRINYYRKYRTTNKSNNKGPVIHCSCNSLFCHAIRLFCCPR